MPFRVFGGAPVSNHVFKVVFKLHHSSLRFRYYDNKMIAEKRKSDDDADYDPTPPSPIPATTSKVAVVQGLPPDVTASDIRTYFATFGSVTKVDFSETTKVARVAFSDPSLVDVMVTMAKTRWVRRPCSRSNTKC